MTPTDRLRLVEETNTALAEIIPPLPEIVVSNDITNVVDAAEQALLDAGAELYVKSGTLVRIVRGSRGTTPGVIRPEDAPVITAAPEDNVRELMGQAARWVIPTERKDAIVMRSTLPPSWAVRALMARGAWNLGPIDAVIAAPAFLADGSIVTEPGYHRNAGLVYEPTRAFPAVPDTPTLAEAVVAIEALLEPLADFPFPKESDRSAVIAAILTCVARAAIDGPTPMFALLGNTPGVGKGLLAAVIAEIGTGRPATLMPPTSRDDESRKRLLALALAGDRCINIDNVEGSFGGTAYAAALTATTFSDRLLGASRNATVRICCTWLMTGNNVRFKGDVGRRIVPINLRALQEHPEDRTGFKHPDLLGWIRAEQPRLLVAALTILRAYHLAGRPEHGKPLFGSFENWDRLVRGALLWAGLPDPLAGQEEIREASDDDLEALRAAADAWHSTFSEDYLHSSEALRRAREITGGTLLDALAGLAGCTPEKLTSQILGKALNRVRDRVVELAPGELRFERGSDAHNKVARWRVSVQP